MYLLDTNVLSELRKGSRCDPNVAAWIQPVSNLDLYVSVLALGEIRKGIELIRKRDAASAAKLIAWLRGLYATYGSRILNVTAAVAEEWGGLNAIRPLAVMDGLIAATAKIHNLTVVTRNVSDMQGVGVQLLNPFDPI